MYQKLTDSGVDVIYDDRDVRPGAMFSDADLIGAPIRVVVRPRNLKEYCIELAKRDKSYKEMVPVEEAFDAVLRLKQKLFDDINAKVEAYE